MVFRLEPDDEGPVRDGERRFTVEVDHDTAAVIAQLCDELESLLDGDSPLLERLFPPPYGDDAERNEGYAALAVPELVERRKASLELLRTGLAGDEATEGEVWAWMRAVNDLRLVLGTALGVTDDDGPPTTPAGMEPTLAAYEFLGGLLDLLVDTLSGG